MKSYRDMCHNSTDNFLSEKQYNILSFKEYITERLQFTTRGDFEKQLRANKCELLDYATTRNGNRYILLGKVLDLYSSGASLEEQILNFNKFLQKYSYRVSRIIRTMSKLYVEIVPENFRDLPTRDFQNLYIHLSRTDGLDAIGMKPKSSKSVDALDMYDERVYLFPLSALLEDTVDIDDEDKVFNSIYKSTERIVKMFNSMRAEKRDYFVYLVDLSKQSMQTYQDPEYTERSAVYVKNYIKPVAIRKIGKIYKE